MKNKSKSKGNRFEISTAKGLSLWISNGKRDDLIFHSSSSGARATTRSKSNQDTANSCGDLCYLDAIAEPYMRDYLWEIKCGYTPKIKKKKDKNGNVKFIRSSGKKISLADLLDGWGNKKSKPLLIEWLDKAKKEAKDHEKKHFIIIYQRDRKDACIVFQQETWNMIKYNNEKEFTMYNGKIAYVIVDPYELVIVRLEDFYSWCYPKALYEKLNIGIKRLKWKSGKYSGKKCIKQPKKEL